MVRDGKPKGFFYLDHRTVDGRHAIITDTRCRLRCSGDHARSGRPQHLRGDRLPHRDPPRRVLLLLSAHIRLMRRYQQLAHFTSNQE